MNKLAVRAATDGSTTFPTTSHERKAITFDFTADLAAGETVVSVTRTFVRKNTGTDYPDVFDGAAIIDGTGKIVTQWINNPPVGTYRMTMIATTSTGQRSEPELTVDVEF